MKIRENLRQLINRQNNVIQLLVYSIGWLTLIGAIIDVVVVMQSGKLNLSVINSDTFFLPLLIRDLFSTGNISGWQIPTHPFLFPEAFFIGFLSLVTSNASTIVMLTGVIQIFLLVFGLIFLFERAFGKSLAMRCVLLLAVSLLLLFFAESGEIAISSLIMIVNHLGVLILALFALGLIIPLLKNVHAGKLKLGYWVSLAAVVILASTSDYLFLVQFSAPICLTLFALAFFMKSKRRTTFALIGVIIVSTWIGNEFRKLLTDKGTINLYVKIDSSLWSRSYSEFITWIEALFTNTPWLGIYALVCLLLVLIVLLKVIGQMSLYWRSTVGAIDNSVQDKDWGSQHSSDTIDVLTLPVFIIVVFLLGSIAVSVTSVLLTGNFLNIHATRYLLPLTLLLPLLAFPIFLLQIDIFRYHSMTYALLLVSLAMLSFLSINMPSHPIAILASIPEPDPFVRCVDDHAKALDIHSGLATYWQAKYISGTSHTGLHVAQVQSNLEIYHWLNNLDEYHRNFDFVMIDRKATEGYVIEEKTVFQRFGIPTTEFSCGNSKIFVYKPFKDIRLNNYYSKLPILASLNNGADEHEFPGYTLRSSIDGTPIGMSLAASERREHDPGVLGTALFPKVASGNYALDLYYFSDSQNTGAWNVSYGVQENFTMVKNGELNETGKNHIRTTLAIPEIVDLRVEIVFKGNGTLYIDKFVLKPIAATEQIEPETTPVAHSEDARLAGQLHSIYPDDGLSLTDNYVDFVWQWKGAPLSEDQSFEIKLWNKEDEYHFGAHDATLAPPQIRQIADTYSIRLDLRGAYTVLQHGANDYFWSVAVVNVKPKYQETGIESSPNRLNLSFQN